MPAAIPTMWLCCSMILWMTWSGCATRVKTLSGSEALIRVKAGQTITATNDFYLVSDPTMKRILRAIGDEKLREAAGGR